MMAWKNSKLNENGPYFFIQLVRRMTLNNCKVNSCRAKEADEEDAQTDAYAVCITCKVDLPAALASK